MRGRSRRLSAALAARTRKTSGARRPRPEFHNVSDYQGLARHFRHPIPGVAVGLVNPLSPSELGPGGQNPVLALITPLLSAKKVKFPVPVDCRRSVLFIRQMLGEGRFKPVIEKTYPVDQIGEAYSYVRSGQKTGNVIIKMAF